MAIMIIHYQRVTAVRRVLQQRLNHHKRNRHRNIAGLIQTIILYATAAITFAYCIRMFSLVFMGK